jgi:hypothetical protein
VIAGFLGIWVLARSLYGTKIIYHYELQKIVTEEEFVPLSKGKSKYHRDFIVVDIFKVLLHDEYVKLLLSI